MKINKPFLTMVTLLCVTFLWSQYNYEDALATSLYFFDANRCGPDAGDDNIYSWRGACHTTDGSSVGVDLTGGFHDAGDHVKFGLPQVWTAATLGMSLYEFREGFDNSGATPELLSTLKYFTDYFIRSHPSANTFYYNVGDGNADHGYWGAPETQTGSRPVIAATPSSPASDICGEAAAALALMYLNYQNVDAAYANECLSHAIDIFNLGRNNLGRSSDGGGGSFYRSTSHFDDLAWGAIWLTIATGDNSYLDGVEEWLDTPNDYNDDPYNKQWAPAWDDVTVFAMLKMYELTGTQKYYDAVINNLEWYRDDLQRTPYGLPWLDQWGVLRYASCEAGVGYLAAKLFGYAGYLETADVTMDYTLGSNPRNSSYLTGWGNNPPVHPHHRANEPNRDGNTNGILGALVGGPGNGDNYQDNVNDYVMNEVAIDYNASFILGMAGRVYFNYNTRPVPNTPPTVSITSPSDGASVNQGDSITISASASDSDGSITRIEFLVGGSVIGEDQTAPYTITWQVPLAGDYTITARAVDDRNESNTSTGVTVTAVSNLPPPSGPNLALNQPATASSLENDSFLASNAVDGNGSSRWSSAFSDPQWLMVDLGATYSISRVILNWEGAAGEAYEIQVSSDAQNWTTVAAIGGGNGGVDDLVFDIASGRYIRMYGTSRTTPYGYSLFEFEVYGETGSGNNPPNASFIASPVSGPAPLAVLFDGSGSTDPDGDSLTYSWDFDDGTNGTGETVSHTFSDVGTYTVTLTVSDGELSHTITQPITVIGAGNNPPNASISASPTSGDAPLVVSFDGSGSTDPDGDSLTYSWDFDDGTNGIGETVSHTFSNVGTYTVTLTVNDGELSHQTSVTITVNDGGASPCDNPEPISLSFSFDGEGEYCWVTSGSIDYINSWNLETLEINGVDYTNTWSNSMPSRINGNYYIYFSGNYAWSHFEANGSGGNAVSAKINNRNEVLSSRIYPNPAEDVVKISSTSRVKTILLFDMFGQQVLKQDNRGLSNGDIQLPISMFNSGLYMLKLVYENQSVQTKPLVIK